MWRSGHLERPRNLKEADQQQSKQRGKKARDKTQQHSRIWTVNTDVVFVLLLQLSTSTSILATEDALLAMLQAVEQHGLHAQLQNQYNFTCAP